jgi:glutamate-1-semialdehyde 2,1-aminomutase
VSRNEELFERAGRVIPGGVNSPVRAFGSVGGTPYFVARAEGPYVWDADGRRYIDLVQSYGAIILGHAHPAIVEAVSRAAADGTSYGAPTEREVVLAETIAARVPGCERVRLVSSGTEATMTAIRLARGFTGRDRIVKFAGCYHGHADQLLVAGGSGVATLGLPGSAGVPAGAVADTMVAPYNQVPELDDTVACVIVEPVAANMGLVPPGAGFLAGLRAECDRVGALLVFDEVITGFRLGPGSAQDVVGVSPDLWTFGKVIGGGLPVGAFGGRAEIMSSLAPEGAVYQAGTLSGNPLATAAGLAALEHLTPDVYDVLAARTARLAAGLDTALAAAGLGRVRAYRTLFGGVFGTGPSGDGVPFPDDYDGAKATDEAAYARFFHAMLDAGVAMAPGAYEVGFCGLAHTDDVVDEVIGIATQAALDASG